MSKYSQYGIFSEQLKALGFGFVTDFNFDAQEAKWELPPTQGKSHLWILPIWYFPLMLIVKMFTAYSRMFKGIIKYIESGTTKLSFQIVWEAALGCTWK